MRQHHHADITGYQPMMRKVHGKHNGVELPDHPFLRSSG